ncbi:hypothetical protein Lqui_2792 [Legionella quinlivanii]|uniref:Uncharacterized protein n=1 Tax=Legionella quinlivanii TaxID=45073 RepID=A0A0W0XKW1_9GAMM|nr:hypothetical protein Lqui_2792 [Legionella quinlivanii]SEG16094.1 hypothetical protein SAMN02746093_02041 [Legionella quinlivanii DSM 21216]STY10423.1 Uncharacterised protein [Legionella quinlivanii]
MSKSALLINEDKYTKTVFASISEAIQFLTLFMSQSRLLHFVRKDDSLVIGHEARFFIASVALINSLVTLTSMAEWPELSAKIN